MVATGTRGETGDPEPPRASFRRTPRTAHEAAAEQQAIEPARRRDASDSNAFAGPCSLTSSSLCKGKCTTGKPERDAAEVDRGPALPKRLS